MLCSISGSNLKKKFINSSNRNYHIYLSEYGSSLTISNDKTYYVIVDSYTASYSPNGLTVIDTYDETTFARDLLAKAIMDGRLDGGSKSYAAGISTASFGDAKEYWYIQIGINKKLYAGLSIKQ